MPSQLGDQVMVGGKAGRHKRGGGPCFGEPNAPRSQTTQGIAGPNESRIGGNEFSEAGRVIMEGVKDVLEILQKFLNRWRKFYPTSGGRLEGMLEQVETDKSNESFLCLQISPVMTSLGLVMNMNQSLLIYESIFESCHEHESIYSYMT